MLSWKRRTKARHQRSDLSAYFDERSDIEGTCSFSGTAMLDGKFKVLNGITTAEEIVKVAQVEGVITG